MLQNRKSIEVVAAVIEVEGQVLCVQRGEHQRSYISMKWEFPGGKLEAGESQSEALKREIAEELELAIEVRAHLTSVAHAYPDFDLVMHAYRCTPLDSDVDRPAITLTEHIGAQWMAVADEAFEALDWAAADVAIVEALRSQHHA